MLIVKCIKNVEKELEIVNLELKRTNNADKELLKEKEELTVYLENYKEALKGLDEIESRIYYKIVYEGFPPTKAIEKVAEENYLRDIKPNNWVYIYNKIYPTVKKLLENA